MFLRLLTSIHGHVGVLAIALLFHPAIVLWRGAPLTRASKVAVALSAGFAFAAFACGVALYSDYRTLVRGTLFLESRTAGLLFETKEHAGFMALAMVLGAAATAFLAPRNRPEYRRAAARVFAAAGVFALVVGGLGTYVTSLATFSK
ncbi:MAG: hypothetical protein R3A78_09815 [Polyangiales bacterium]|nr:hypothetical protein [Myxococcales bacterium]